MPDEGVSRRRAGGRLMRDEKDNEKKEYRRIQSKRLQRQIMLQGYSCMQSGCQVSEPDLFQSDYVLIGRAEGSPQSRICLIRNCAEKRGG